MLVPPPRAQHQQQCKQVRAAQCRDEFHAYHCAICGRGVTARRGKGNACLLCGSGRILARSAGADACLGACVTAYDGCAVVRRSDGRAGTLVASGLSAYATRSAWASVAPSERDRFPSAAQDGVPAAYAWETGASLWRDVSALVRALAACKRYGVDLINLSYGEPFYESTSGRVAETFDDAVRKWSMTVFTSAGTDLCGNQTVS